MAKYNQFCQSCSIPKDKDPLGGGTNADGSKSDKYCGYCYTDGKFNDDFTESKQMVTFVKEQLKKQGYGPIKRWFFTLLIPQLERWKK